MADKKTIGMTAAGRGTMTRLMSTGFFKDQMEAAKFAMALAIANRVEPGEAHGTDTTWATGNFDYDGDLRTVLPALYPGVDSPYRLLEYLLDEGLGSVAQQSGGAGSIDVLKLIRQVTSK